MDESSSSPEVPEYRSEQVVEAFKKFPQGGINTPGGLLETHPEVIDADRILYGWHEQEENKAHGIGTPEARLQFDLDRSTIHVDAGFSNPDYLDEVANDWLAQDLQAAEDAGLNEMAARIQSKIDEVKVKINLTQI